MLRDESLPVPHFRPTQTLRLISLIAVGPC
jgi:hypothetical protein